MNLKLVVVAVSLLALQCSALTPDELLKNFALIQSNLLAREEAVKSNLQNYLSILSNNVNASENALDSELEKASQPFWDAIDVLTVKAAENGKNISLCTDDIFNQFIQLQSEALAKARNKIVTVYETGVEILSNVTDSLTNANKKFNQLANKFTSDCTDSCATELNSELIEFYQSVLSDINSAVAEAIEYIFTIAPNDLASNVLDTDQLQSDYEELIQTVEACVDG